MVTPRLYTPCCLSILSTYLILFDASAGTRAELSYAWLCFNTALWLATAVSLYMAAENATSTAFVKAGLSKFQSMP